METRDGHFLFLGLAKTDYSDNQHDSEKSRCAIQKPGVAFF
jgi:hypothetical protein